MGSPTLLWMFPKSLKIIMANRKQAPDKILTVEHWMTFIYNKNNSLGKDTKLLSKSK